VLATVDQTRKLATLMTLVLPGGPIAEDVWYRLTMDAVVTGGTVTVTGKVFRHLTAADPDSAVGAQIGNTMTFSGPLPAGVDPTGEVGIIASAISAVVDSSVANFLLAPEPPPGCPCVSDFRAFLVAGPAATKMLQLNGEHLKSVVSVRLSSPGPTQCEPTAGTEVAPPFIPPKTDPTLLVNVGGIATGDYFLITIGQDGASCCSGTPVHIP
jgi:hypothetical protein